MDLSSYFDFAENDFQYFMFSYDNGMVANMMGAMAQGICEKYMKYLISAYDSVNTKEEVSEQQNILRTHSLTRLIKYLDKKLNIIFSKETVLNMKAIDGFYFSTRYPGDDSIELDKTDIETCRAAVEGCRSEVQEFMKMEK